MRRRFLYLALCAALLARPRLIQAQELSLDGLSRQEMTLLQATVELLDPFISRRRSQGTAPLITFEELYARLMPRQVEFMESFRRLDPSQTGGSNRKLPPPAADARFVRIEGQGILRDGKPAALDVQYLPWEVHEAYRRMMAAMEADLGRRLLVESGYRSPAYQLYLFLFYMPKHGASVRETNRFVALPGFSEHGCPTRQAIDFITPGGINGEDRPEEFEELQEYGWLKARAGEFGFHLSYPRRNPMGPDPAGSDPTSSAFEPWHWHYESIPETVRPTS
ncbi:MAG: D-alanyl-D-alanine carboxypeptidase family protein [Candidatus Omnitrophica bacterium]|nr:D-alanyl-D-alanine carboxypeptidase family protein [Candidatus Omnitrophota bacterium]